MRVCKWLQTRTRVESKDDGHVFSVDCACMNELVCRGVYNSLKNINPDADFLRPLHVLVNDVRVCYTCDYYEENPKSKPKFEDFLSDEDVRL